MRGELGFGGLVVDVTDRIYGQEDLKQFGIETLAGLAGERVALGQPCGHVTEPDYDIVSGDLKNLNDLLFGGSLVPEDEYVALVNSCLQEAYALLTQHRDLHQRLTDALIERRRLSYDECLAIFEQQADEVSIGSIDRQGCWL